MKKFSLFLIVMLVFSVNAHAQDEWRLDSTYVEDDNQVRSAKYEYEYNADRELIFETETDYTNGTVYKYVYSYNDDGIMVLLRVFVGDEVIEELEVTEFNALGNPKVYTIKSADKGQPLSLYGKYVMSYTDDQMVQEVHLWNGSEYELYYVTTSEFNDEGQLIKETIALPYGAMMIDYMTTIYEYDRHGEETKATEVDYLGNEVTTFSENTYDDNGNLKKIRKTTEGKPASNEFFFWSKFSSTGINGIMANKVITDWFDLNGRHLNGKPTKKGLYILNGQKIMVK